MMTRPCQQDCQGNKWDQLLHVHKIHHVAINYIITLFHCSSKHELSGHDNASRTEEEGRWQRNCRGNKRVALSHVHASQPPLDLQLCLYLCLYLCLQFYLYFWEINKLYFHTSTLLRHHNSKLPASALNSLFCIRPNFLTKLQTFTFATCVQKKEEKLAPERDSNPLSLVLVTVVKRTIWADHRGNDA